MPIPRRADSPLRLATACLAVAALACAEDRERLEPPTVRVELDQEVVAPGDTVFARVTGVDRSGGIVRLAARLCIDSGFVAARINPDRVDSVSFTFRLVIPGSTLQNARVIVEAQANDAQNFLVTTRDTLIARSPDFPQLPPRGQPTCARPGTGT